MISINSSQNNRIKEIKKLRQKKHRQRQGNFVVEGDKMIREALRLNLVQELYVTEEKKDYFDCQECFLISEALMKSISRMETPPGALAVVSFPQNTPKQYRTLVVEDLRDPGNMGTIIRSCEAFGFNLGLLANCVDPYNEKSVQASMGSIFRVSIEEWTYEKLDALKGTLPILGSRLEGGQTLDQVHDRDKAIILVGNESKGLSQQAQMCCTDFIYIPMEGHVESLNASIAASILMYHWNRE